jgi:hypothetical protein
MFSGVWTVVLAFRWTYFEFAIEIEVDIYFRSSPHKNFYDQFNQRSNLFDDVVLYRTAPSFYSRKRDAEESKTIC